MKETVLFTELQVWRVGAPLVRDLITLFPAGCLYNGDEFHAELVSTDPIVPRLRARIASSGMKAWSGGDWSLSPSQYREIPRVVFDSEDYLTCRYASFESSSEYRFEDHGEGDNPPAVVLEGRTLPQSHSHGTSDRGRWIVTKRGRDGLEKLGLQCVDFVPAFHIDPDDDDFEDVIERARSSADVGRGEPEYWWLRPRVVLAVMLPPKYPVNRLGKIEQFRNPNAFDHRLAYTTQALTSAGPFDIARPNPADGAAIGKSVHVCSRRVFEHMRGDKRFNLADWMPVREE